MNAFFSNLTAAKLWQIPALDVILGTSNTLQIPTYVTIRDEGCRTRRTSEKMRVISRELPPNAVAMHNSCLIATPEMLFLEFSGELDFHRALLFGLTICGHPAGKYDNSISSVEKLRNFIEGAKGFYGSVPAATILKYVKNGSASVMESLLYMLLALPHKYGGYSLTGVEFNRKIAVTKDGIGAKNKNFYIDLFWADTKFGLEYDSYSYHSSAKSWAKDSRKIAVLKRLGYDVTSINTSQLYDTKSMDIVAHNIAKALKKRIRVRCEKYSDAQNKLRGLFPRLEG
jgi:very-short-patch-repair endonuclease